jgi:hypothetical protein
MGQRVSIDVKELATIPYLRVEAIKDRALELPAFWDGAAWHVWIPQHDGKLFHARPQGMGEGSYVASEPAHADDIHFPFAEFAWKRASWSDVSYWRGAIIEDLHQLAASVAKIDFFWTARENVPQGSLGVRRFVGSELECLLTVCRSTFDQLQEVIRAIWKRVRLLDKNDQRRKRELRGSFAEMVIANGKLMTEAQIAEQRRVPLPLAAMYESAGEFLKVLRDLRDGIVHRGKDAPVVLVAERGFIVGKEDAGFASLPIWKPEHSFNERCLSLRPAIAYLVMATLATCNAFADVLAQIIEFPPDLSPAHRLLIRSAHGGALIRAQRVLQAEASPWWSDAG